MMTRRKLLQLTPLAAAAAVGVTVGLKKGKAQQSTLQVDQGILDALNNTVAQMTQNSSPNPGDYSAVATSYQMVSGYLERAGVNAVFEGITRQSPSLALGPDRLAWIRGAWYAKGVVSPIDPAALVGADHSATVGYIQQNGLQALSVKTGNLLAQAASDQQCSNDPNCVTIPYYGQQGNPTAAQQLMELGSALSLLSAIWAAGPYVAALGPTVAGATIVCPVCTGVAVTFAVLGGGLLFFGQYGTFGGFTVLPYCGAGGTLCAH
jgi:hypothetical protein